MTIINHRVKSLIWTNKTIMRVFTWWQPNPVAFVVKQAADLSIRMLAIMPFINDNDDDIDDNDNSDNSTENIDRWMLMWSSPPCQIMKTIT